MQYLSDTHFPKYQNFSIYLWNYVSKNILEKFIYNLAICYLFDIIVFYLSFLLIVTLSVRWKIYFWKKKLLWKWFNRITNNIILWFMMKQIDSKRNIDFSQYLSAYKMVNEIKYNKLWMGKKIWYGLLNF